MARSRILAAAVARIALTLLVSGVAVAEDDGPKIGKCEGTTYEVLSSRETVGPDSVRCGTHGETPTGVNARFKVELRAYTECKDGSVVKTWRDTVEEFVRCEAP
ncbi:MAG: hypothetical protein ABI895_17510 [Deltaproteobacteria bacterium]